MADFKTDHDALWAAVTEKLEAVVNTRISIPAGRNYFFIASKAHKDKFNYNITLVLRDKIASVGIETFNGEPVRDAINAIIAEAPNSHIVKSANMKQGAKNKSKWAWSVVANYEQMSNEEMVDWHVKTITDFYTFFEGATIDCPNSDANP